MNSKLLVLILSLFVWSPSFAKADTATKATNDYLKIYKASHSFAELFGKLKPRLSEAEFQFLNQLLATDLKGVDLPKIDRGENNQLVFRAGSLSVPVEFDSLEEKTFKVNNRVLQMADLKTAEEHYRAILAALPESKRKTSSMNWIPELFVSRAFAQAQLIAPIARGAGAAIGAGSLAMDLYGNNSYYCAELKTSSNACTPPIKKLMNLAREFKKEQEAAVKTKKSVPICPDKGDEDRQDKVADIENEAQLALDDVKTKTNAGYNKLTVNCDEEKDLAQVCIDTIGRLSKYLCLNTETDLKALSRASKAVTAPVTGGK